MDVNTRYKPVPGPERMPGAIAKRVPSARGWILPVLCLTSSPALAADWEVTPRISGSVEITDNVTLAPRGEESSDLIGRINPGVNLRRISPRMETRVSYRLNSRYHASESQEDRVSHHLRARSDWEVIPDTFFIEARASRRENVSSLLAPVGIDGSTPRGNLEETTRYSLSPVLRTRFGSFAEQELRYTYDEIRYHGSDRPNSDAHRVEYTLDSGAAFNRPFWQVAASHEKERFESGPEGEFSEVSGTLGYRFGRSLRLFGVAGYEDNDFPTTREDVDGGFWEVGANWAPTRVTRIDGRYGERYFGKTRAFSLDHRSRRASYRLSFNEGITSTRERRGAQFNELSQQLGMTVDELFDQFTLEEVSFLLAISGLTEEAVVANYFFTRTWRASWSYDTGRSVFGVNAFQTQRESELESGLGLFQDNRRRTGINASWQWNLGPRTTSELSTGFSNTEFLGVDREDDRWYLRASVSREITPVLTARLALRHQRRDSDSRANEYRENSIIGMLIKEF